MEISKSDIRQLLGEGLLEETTEAALAYAEHCHLPDIANTLLGLQSRIRDHHKKWNSGQIDYSSYSVVHAQITQGLTDCISRLPDEPTPAGPRRKFLTEAVFKKRIFILLVLIKVLVFFLLWYHYGTGGFSMEQFQGTAALLLPTLAAYVSVVLASYLREARQAPKPERYISGMLVGFAYWIFPLYAIALVALIILKAKSSISFVQMNFWLAMVESVLGGYVGQMLHAFFKEER